MIIFDSVTVRARESILLHHVSFTVERGEKVVIGGPTGSGKSTVLLTLLGAHVPVSGTVLFDGTPVSVRTIAAVRQNVAFIAQEPVLGTGSVREGLLVPFTFKANRHRHPSDEAVRSVLERLALPATILDRAIGLISGGEKQRVAIARALLMGKEVFVVDEITSALDEESNRVVLELFLRSGFTVLAVSHHPRWQERFDRLITLRGGTVEAIRTKRETRP